MVVGEGLKMVEAVCGVEGVEELSHVLSISVD